MNHLQAKQIVDSLPGMTAAMSALVRAIAWRESSYGQGWKGAGENSHNMGAITGSYNGAFFIHEDSRWDDKLGKVVQYETKFAVYPDDITGFAAIANILRRKWPDAEKAVPDWYAVSRAMYGYYLGTKPKEQAIEEHAKWLASGWGEITASTGEETPKGASSGIALVGLAIALAGGMWALKRRTPGRRNPSRR